MKKLFATLLSMTVLLGAPVANAGTDQFSGYTRRQSNLNMTCLMDKGPQQFSFDGDVLRGPYGTPFGSISAGTLLKQPGHNVFKATQFIAWYVDFDRKLVTIVGFGELTYRCY